jgi:AcrR family transcriptional regulator
MTEKKENRVDDIVEAAISEFIERGYQVASMESIAKRSGLSKGGLYHHFNSKVEILLAVNLKILEPIQALIAQIEVSNSIVDGLCKFVVNYLDFWNNHKRELNLYFLTMNESFSNPAIMDLYKESTKQFFLYFESIFQHGEESGIFKPGNAHARAVSLISCLDGFLGYLLIDESLSTEEIGSEIQNIFIHNILM